jgi:hypothetical protein
LPTTKIAANIKKHVEEILWFVLDSNSQLNTILVLIIATYVIQSLTS